jgi:hypothetical protein
VLRDLMAHSELLYLLLDYVVENQENICLAASRDTGKTSASI